jgi:3-dehydrosphinganine reductase
MARDLAGRHVLVVGGSSGIGLATAKEFAGRGADVTLIARDRDRLEAVCEAVSARRRDTAQQVRWVSGDMSEWEGAQRAIERATSAGERPIDILVSCAGVIIPGYFESMPLENFDECMRSGYFTCVYAARAVAPSMMERKSGHIVCVSSMAGFLGLFGYTAYSPAKYAVIGFAEALRSEMKPHGIAVSVVCPSDTDTPGLAFEKTLRPPETDRLADNVAPVSPAFVADRLVSGVERGKFLIIPDATSRFYRWAKGNALWLFFAITDADVRKARAERGL